MRCTAEGCFVQTMGRTLGQLSSWYRATSDTICLAVNYLTFGSGLDLLRGSHVILFITNTMFISIKDA